MYLYEVEGEKKCGEKRSNEIYTFVIAKTEQRIQLEGTEIILNDYVTVT